MKKIYSLLCMMLVMASAFLFASCGDDNDDEDSLRKAIVGTWKCDIESEEQFFETASELVIFYSNGEFESQIKFPAGFRETLSSNDAKNIDDDGFFYRGKGHWNLKGNQIISRVEQEYCYENHNDWEWHNVKEDADTALVSVNGDKMTSTVVMDSSTGELMTGTLTRLK